VQSTLGFRLFSHIERVLNRFQACRAFDSYYLQAQRVRRMLQIELDSLFSSSNPLRPSSTSSSSNSVDFLIHPTTISPAPLLSSFTSPTSTSKQSSYVQDLLSLPASLAGLPAISVPVGKAQGEDEGWPVGMTFVGQWGNDRAVLDCAQIVESALKQ